MDVLDVVGRFGIVAGSRCGAARGPHPVGAQGVAGEVGEASHQVHHGVGVVDHAFRDVEHRAGRPDQLAGGGLQRLDATLDALRRVERARVVADLLAEHLVVVGRPGAPARVVVGAVVEPVVAAHALLRP